MKKLLSLALIAAMTMPVAYADNDCGARAAEKKLAGAAKNSFMKKCQKDNQGPAEASCEARAKDKKLAGAAKNSFMKKCVTDGGPK